MREARQERASPVQLDQVRPEARGYFVSGDDLEADYQFRQVIVFDDLDGDGAFDLGDRILEQVPLGPTSNLTWDLGQGRTLRIIEQGTELGVKFDVELRGFAPGRYVAVESLLDSARGRLQEQPAQVQHAFENQRLELAWVGNVTVDGVDQPVGATVLHQVQDTGVRTSILWAYPTGASILHDPTLRVIQLEAPQVAWGMLGLSILAACGIFALSATRRRRFD